MRVRASRFRPFFSTVSHSRFHRPAGGSLSWSGARGWVRVCGGRDPARAVCAVRATGVRGGGAGGGRACKNCFMLCFMLS